MTDKGTAGKLQMIGYFRFVEKFATPIHALAEAIRAEQKNHPNEDISNSLIVLPEAFNLGHEYDPPACHLCARDILERLRKDLATPLSIAFVVGILDGDKSSAYWVDTDGTELLCHKMGDDRKGLYAPCCQNPDRRNPIVRNNARVGVFICMDATCETDDIPKRRNSVLADLKEGDGNKILCVPARFSSNSPNPLSFHSIIPGYWYVLADGSYNSPSFVAHVHDPLPDNPIEARKIESNAPLGNEVRLWPLAEALGEGRDNVGAPGKPVPR